MESTGTPAAATTAKQQTSATSFAASGFAKLGGSSTSPFGALGGAGKPSPFASASSTSFGSVLGAPKQPAAAPSSPPKLSFGSKTTSSPFAGLNGQASGSVFKSSPFASAFGGSALSGPRLANFGKPGEVLKSDKPAKPFGAPDSDAEAKSGDEESGDEGSNDDAASDNAEDKEAEREKDESKLAAGDDKKKPKLQKSEFEPSLPAYPIIPLPLPSPLTRFPAVVVDDGEGQEVTLFSARAKMYIMEKGVGWKERGAGMLKINVPKSTVELDDQGAPDPWSFDASALEGNGGEGKGEQGGGDSGGATTPRRNVRLIMRQDHTLRVILNTIVLPAMKFQLTRKLKAATVLFTAFEGGEARQVQMKVRFSRPLPPTAILMFYVYGMAP